MHLCKSTQVQQLLFTAALWMQDWKMAAALAGKKTTITDEKPSYPTVFHPVLSYSSAIFHFPYISPLTPLIVSI